MVFVYEPVSYWSDRMEGTTFRDPGVSKVLSEKFVFVKVLSVDNGELLKKHNIDRFPTVFFEWPPGEVLVTRHVGYLDVHKMLDVLTRTLEIASKRSMAK